MKYLLGIFLSVLAITSNADCPQLYPYNTPIVVPNTIELCNDAYVSVYDPTEKKVIFTSELLQPSGHVIQRKNSFHGDSRTSKSVIPSDYDETGYDRGHMTPADDSVSAVQMYQSFLMTNMTPQDPKLNRGRWKSLETQSRSKVSSYGEATHIVTGATYTEKVSVNGIPVPTAYYKIVYIPNSTLIIQTLNNSTDSMHKTSLEWVNDQTGIRFPE